MANRDIKMIKTTLSDLVEPSSGAGLDPDAVDDGVLWREDGLLLLCQEGGEKEEGGEEGGEQHGCWEQGE